MWSCGALGWRAEGVRGVVEARGWGGGLGFVSRVDEVGGGGTGRGGGNEKKDPSR